MHLRDLPALIAIAIGLTGFTLMVVAACRGGGKLAPRRPSFGRRRHVTRPTPNWSVTRTAWPPLSKSTSRSKRLCV